MGVLAGFRGADGSKKGVGEPNPDQLQRYIENGCFWRDHIPEEQGYFKHTNAAYLAGAKAMGLIPNENQIVMQIWSEPLQKFRLAAQGHGAKQPPEHLRARVEKYCDPLPIWYTPLEQQMHDLAPFPLSAITQRPMHMYHSWGSQNGWLRQITAENRLYIHPERAREIGVADDGWVWVSSSIGRIKCQVRLMQGVNPQTVWTWNAIGKRAGTWGLSPDAPEAKRGFLLNHLITELLPEREGGYRFSNSDPITGQAAWYDLKVRIEKAPPEEGESEPRFETLKAPPPYRGSLFRRSSGGEA